MIRSEFTRRIVRSRHILSLYERFPGRFREIEEQLGNVTAEIAMLVEGAAELPSTAVAVRGVIHRWRGVATRLRAQAN
jgi:hypothetical protein